MATTSKYCVEQWVEYDKSKAKLNFDVDVYDRSYGGCFDEKSESSYLPKIDEKWYLAVEPDYDDDGGYDVNVNVYVCLKVKDSKMLQLFRAKTVVDLSFEKSEKRETEYEKILNEKNMFKITQFCDDINTKSKWKKWNDSREFSATAVMTIYMKRLIKNKISMNDILNEHCKAADKDELTEDFSFIVKGREFKVNKARLSKVSNVMTAMLQPGFLESATQTAEIVDIDPDIFQIFLYFSNDDRTNFMEALKLGHICSLFKAAHKYQVEGLMDFCTAVMFEHFTMKDRVVETYEFACYYNIEDLKMYCWDIIQFDILKIFQPMEPLSAEKVADHLNTIKSYFKRKVEMDQEALQHHNELFSSTIKLDDDRLQSFAKAYTAEVVSDTSHLIG